MDATELGEGRTVDATHNYWGTIDESSLPVLGEVDPLPLLDSNLELPASTTMGPVTTNPTTTASTTTAPNTTNMLSVGELTCSTVELLSILLFLSFAWFHSRRRGNKRK